VKLPDPKDLLRLKAVAAHIEKNERYFQGRHGDPAPGSVRVSLVADAAAIRRVLAFVDELRKGGGR
jgi:hypothetical protein